jgi:hypothetical protein
MIEATSSVHQAQLHARMSRAVIVLARQRAIAAVKREIQRQGRRKLSQVAHREIVVLAKEYLAGHPELIDEARPIIDQWRAEEFFGKRAALSVRNVPELRTLTSGQGHEEREIQR